MRLLRSGLILGLGFFALAAQTVLFRDFLAAFEGSELGVGSFFGSWLLWVGLGAMAGRLAARHPGGLTGRFELTVLLYLPAFLLQQYLIAHARQLGGVPAYEVYPFGRMFLVSLIANAPVSLTTGLLFTLACRWWEHELELPPARVYMLEAFGGFLGGAVVTFLLVRGATAESVIVFAALVLVGWALGGWFAADRSSRSGVSGAVLLAILVALVTIEASGLAARWSRWNDRAQWSRLLPADEFRGSFATAQAKYLHGRRGGQFVVMSWGGVSETLPNTEHASEVVAMALSQHPAAGNVLVVGTDSLGLCLRLGELPQIRQVVWLHPDPQYPSALRRVLPSEVRTAAQQLDVPGEEVREYLQSQRRRFDLVLLNLPDPTTLVLNRYRTSEFFQLVKESLVDGGIVCVRFSGAANYMGDERVYLGSSALATLQSVFRTIALKPGDESWWIASDSDSPSMAPAELCDRFAGIEGAAGLYPPEGLMSLYPPDRIEFQMGKYAQAAASVDPALLLSRDQQPKSLIFSLLLALRRTTLLSFARHVPIFWAGGIWIAATPVVIYGLLRFLYLLAPRGGHATPESAAAAAAFDGRVLVFATGLSGMSLSVVLMFLYQSRYGSLFLDIGLVSALFMLGTFVGSLLGERFVLRLPRLLLPAGLALNLALLALAMILPQDASRAAYAVLFVACGLFVGLYFPIGAHRLRAAGHGAAAAGASLEMLDHWGGAAGALVSGWLLLPLLGTRLTLGVLALVVAVNLVPAIIRARPGYLPSDADWFDGLLRPAGYTLAGLAASALAVSNVVAVLGARQATERVHEAALAMTGGSELVAETASDPAGSTLRYWSVAESGSEDSAGFVFGTESLAGNVAGYGGPILLAVYVAPDGTLRDLRVVQSCETPAYLASLQNWLRDLSGKNVFRQSDLEGVDAVTGVTITSDAILRSLRQAGPQFALALGLEAETAAPAPAEHLDPQVVGLAVLLGAALVLRCLPWVWLRRAMLLVTLVLTGLVWNLQYSSQQVLGLLSLNLPSSWLSGSLLLVLVVPIVVILVGNVYCGYVCAFGALQELVGDLRPHNRLQTDPKQSTWRYGRAVKYVLLALLVLLFALTRDYGVLTADPLLTVFSPLRDRWTLTLALALVALSFFFRRFWCRNLCPAGAFLSLLGGAAFLRPLLPRPQPARCDLGVRTAHEIDCLSCNRCRHGKD